MTAVAFWMPGNEQGREERRVWNGGRVAWVCSCSGVVVADDDASEKVSDVGDAGTVPAVREIWARCD